jgi:DNA-binding transcriptional ArsR family regulator
MAREMKTSPRTGVSVSLSIPAKDPGLFKHKATNDILVLLSRHRFEKFTIGELARQTDHTKPTVSRAVDVLSGNGLVEEEPRGNRRLIQINRERLTVPDDPLMQVPQEEFQEPVKAAVEALKDGVDEILGIVLYGSVARGEADRRSDIDLWVLVAEDRA